MIQGILLILVAGFLAGILVTAPLGTFGTAFLAPRMLQKGTVEPPAG